MNNNFEYGFSHGNGVGFGNRNAQPGQGVLRCHVSGRSAKPEDEINEMQSRFERDTSGEIHLALPATTRLRLRWMQSSPTSCTADSTFGIYVVIAREESPRWISHHYHDHDLNGGGIDLFVCSTVIEAMVACEQHFSQNPVPEED